MSGKPNLTEKISIYNTQIIIIIIIISIILLIYYGYKSKDKIQDLVGKKKKKEIPLEKDDFDMKKIFDELSAIQTQIVSSMAEID